MSEREKWLNGFSRNGGLVMIFPAFHCAACGTICGPCAAFAGDCDMPEIVPCWPFTEGDCPVCDNAKNISTFNVEELSRLGESILRKAMILAKKRKRNNHPPEIKRRK